MIGCISSNRSVFTSAAVVVASSVVLGVFLSRMGWHGAMQQYPAAMYALMGGGGAAFACLCVTSARRKAPILDPGLVMMREVKAYLEKPTQNQNKVIEALQNFGIPRPVGELVLDYMYFPNERDLIRLEMGISLSSNNPNFALIIEAIATYAKSRGESVQTILSLIHEPPNLPLSYVHLRAFAAALKCRWNPPLDEDSMHKVRIFGMITTLLLHHHTDENEMVPNDSVEATTENEVFGTPQWVTNPNRPIRLLTMLNEREGIALYLRHMHPFCDNLLYNPMERLATEEMALIILEEFFAKYKARSNICTFLSPIHGVEKGWTRYVKRVFELNDELYRKSLNCEEIWSTLIASRMVQKVKVPHPSYNKLQYSYILKANYVAMAIILLKQQIWLPAKLRNFLDASPAELVREHTLTDLEELFTFLGPRERQFYGVLEREQLAALDQWAANRNLIIP